MVTTADPFADAVRRAVADAAESRQTRERMAFAEAGLDPDDAESVWTPHPGFQEQFLAASEDDALGGGAAGPGKTDCLLVGSLRQITHPRSRQLFLRTSFPELRDVMDRAHRLFTPLGFAWHASDKRWVAPSGGSLEFGYCGDYADAQRYWGQEYTRIAFDEIGRLPEERAWDFVASRLRVPVDVDFPQAWLEQRCSANPGGPGHGWLRARYVVPTHGGTRVFVDPTTGKTRAFYPGRLSDNPSLGVEYLRQLQQLPERLRRQLLDGDWDAGEGLALEELDERKHLVRPFIVPKHWTRWAGFDWGYRHPWWFVVVAESPDGERFVIDAITGRKQLPHEIAATIVERVNPETLTLVAAGHDALHEKQAMADGTPTIAETLQRYGVTVTPANIARVQGLNRLRQQIAWRGLGPDGTDDVPVLRFFATPAVRALFDQCRTIPVAEKNPEDAEKLNADPDTGKGGDDGYDALRYAIATRTAPPQPALPETPLSTFDPAVLRLEAERGRRLRDEYAHSRGHASPTDALRHVPNAWEVF